MRGGFYFLMSLAVMGLAVWAYQQNYRTQESLRDVTRLEREIAGLREQLGIYRAEWAYLNRPDRLRELADMNWERLRLMPLTPDHFGFTDEVTYPAPALPEILDPIDLTGAATLGEEGQQP